MFARAMIARATGCEGIRTATVDCPAVITEVIWGGAGKSIVRGPGQKARMSAAYAGEGVYDVVEGSSVESMILEDTCTMRGLSAGLPLVENILEDAVAFNASAPRPYTVSVGKTTTSRSLMS